MAEDDKVLFELVSPERLLASEQVDMVVVPGAEGDFGVLPRHAPLLSVLRPGVVGLWQGNAETTRIFVAGGFAEVNEEGCTVLAEEALPVDQIDSGHARQRLGEAEEDLAGSGPDAPEQDRARLERAVEVARAMVEAGGGGPS